jgi:hypothetical protein
MDITCDGAFFWQMLTRCRCTAPVRADHRGSATIGGSPIRIVHAAAVMQTCGSSELNGKVLGRTDWECSLNQDPIPGPDIWVEHRGD